MALAVGIKGKTRAIDGDIGAYRRQRVLQHAPRAAVHVHVAAGHERQPEAPALLGEPGKLPTLPAVGEQLHRDP